MPIYEYICEDCGTERELIQKRNDPGPACGDCGDKPMVKVLSAHRVGASKGPCGEPMVGDCGGCGVDRPPCG